LPYFTVYCLVVLFFPLSLAKEGKQREKQQKKQKKKKNNLEEFIMIIIIKLICFIVLEPGET